MDPLRKVNPGDDFFDVVTSDMLNRHSQSSDIVLRGLLNKAGLPQDYATNRNIIIGKNSTQDDLPRFGAGVMVNPIYEPNHTNPAFQSLEQFLNGPIIRVQRANSNAFMKTDKLLKVAIAQEAIPEDELGEFLISGITPAQVDIISDSHRWADCLTNEATLVSSSSGGARIIWYDTQEPSSVKWCLLHVGTGHDTPRYQRFLFEPTHDGVNKAETDLLSTRTTALNQWSSPLYGGGSSYAHPEWEASSGGTLTCAKSGWYRFDVNIRIVGTNPGAAAHVGCNMKYAIGSATPLSWASWPTMASAYPYVAAGAAAHISGHWTRLDEVTAGQRIGFSLSAFTVLTSPTIEAWVTIGERIEW